MSSARAGVPASSMYLPGLAPGRQGRIGRTGGQNTARYFLCGFNMDEGTLGNRQRAANGPYAVAAFLFVCFATWKFGVQPQNQELTLDRRPHVMARKAPMNINAGNWSFCIDPWPMQACALGA